jgi:hypothetical protein
MSSTRAEILLDRTSRSDADAALTEERSTHPRQSRQTPFCAVSDNAKGPAQPLLHSMEAVAQTIACLDFLYVCHKVTILG